MKSATLLKGVERIRRKSKRRIENDHGKHYRIARRSDEVATRSERRAQPVASRFAS
jgi:hypothetical protein